VLPDISFLVGLVLGLFSLAEAAEHGPSPVFAVGGTAAVVLAVAALARMSADRAIRAADETDPVGVLAATRRMTYLPLLGWVLALLAFEWGTFVAGAVPSSWFMVSYVVLLLPLFALFASTWVAARRIEARLAPDAAPTALGAIGKGFRRNLVVLAPLGILLGFAELVRVLAALGVPGVERAAAWHAAFPDLAAAGMLAMLFVLGALAPSIFRRALKATPIPPGDLRRDLERLAAAIGLRTRDFLLWDTRGRVANAMVVGIVPRTRYVFLTDALLGSLSRPEISAVVAHEAGHAKLRHLPLYFVVAMSLLLLSKAVEEALRLDAVGQLWASLTFLFVFWFVVLGWLSRRFEREADAFGADHGGALEPDAPPVETAGVERPVPYGAALMMAVLRRLEKLMGPARHHRHAPPTERVAFLAAYGTDPAVRAEHLRERRRTRLAILGLVVAALGVTAWRMPAGIERGRVRLERIEGERLGLLAQDAHRRGDEAAARDLAVRARERFASVLATTKGREDDPALALDAAISAYDAAEIDRRRLGDPASARAGFERALALSRHVGDPALEALIAFHASVDLGLLALATPPGADGRASPAALEEARARLAAAKGVPHERFTSALRRARERLLESAIRVREADPARAAQAAADLRAQAETVAEGDEWLDVREDAAEHARAAPR
jgi:Zn-dependent protease with chaperone function